MRLQQFGNSQVRNTFGREVSVLKADELYEPKSSVRKALEPAGDFTEMVFIYRLSDVERRRLKVQINNPGIIAVIA
jgi:hypothetical protein